MVMTAGSTRALCRASRMAGQRHNSNHWVAFHHKRPRPPGVHSSLMVVPQHHYRSSLWPFRTVVGVADNNNNNNNNSNQQRCFSNRRANQEEASGTTTGVMIRSVYDSSPHWEDWFSPEEYGPPYDYHSTTAAAEAAKKSSTITKRRSMWLEPLEDDPSLDASSRHFIKQLQVLYHDKFNRDETITTRRCHSMIHRLLSSAEEVATTRSQQQQQDGATAPDHGKNIAVMTRQRVMRAVAILRTMELFWEFVPGVFASATAAKRTTATQKQQQQRHGSNASKWPLPTYELYADMAKGLAALRASKQYDLVQNADVPFVCQEILLRWNDLHKEKGMVYLKKPPVEAWNQVLSAWANAHGDRDHPEKALYATQFLLDMKTEYNVTPDASSYGHVLRACAHNDQNKIAEELGGRLAIRLWTGFMKEDLEQSLLMPTSYTYVFFMRALSNVPDAEKAEYYLREAWASVCAIGLVNEHVLSELENSSDLLFKDLLREYRNKMTPAQKVQPKTAYDKTYHRELLKLIPFEWKRRLMDKEKLLQENTGK